MIDFESGLSAKVAVGKKPAAKKPAPKKPTPKPAAKKPAPKPAPKKPAPKPQVKAQVKAAGKVSLKPAVKVPSKPQVKAKAKVGAPLPTPKPPTPIRLKAGGKVKVKAGARGKAALRAVALPFLAAAAVSKATGLAAQAKDTVHTQRAKAVRAITPAAKACNCHPAPVVDRLDEKMQCRGYPPKTATKLLASVHDSQELVEKAAKQRLATSEHDSISERHAFEHSVMEQLGRILAQLPSCSATRTRGNLRLIKG